MDLAYRQRSGKHHQIVNGINLETVFWTKNDTNKCLQIMVMAKIMEQVIKLFTGALF
jgi:hypothetical protein